MPPSDLDRVANDGSRGVLETLAQRIRRLDRSGRLSDENLTALHPLWRRALELAQQHVASPDNPSRLISVEQLLHRIETQLALVEFTRETAARLAPLAVGLVTGTESSARRLRNLSAELVCGLSEGETQPAVIPEPGISLAAILERDGCPQAEWLAEAVLSWRLTAAVLPRMELDAGAGTWLQVASLVRDIGQWRTINRPSLGRHRSDPNHPAAGAALLNGLEECSVALGLMVGAHHERIDGSGFPQRLSGRRLSREQQFLGLVVRLTEWLLDPITGTLAQEHQESLALAAGLRLWRDVRRGAFDEGLSRTVLDGLVPRLADEIELLYPARVQRIVDRGHEVPAPRGPLPAKTAPAADEASPVGPPAFLRHSRGRRGGLLAGLSRESGAVR